MSQKRNKIIVLIGLIIVIGFIVFIYLQKTKQSLKINFSSKNDVSLLYDLCKAEYLEQPQIHLEEKTVAAPPQVFCKVEDNIVELIPNNKVTQELKAGDSIIMIVNVPQLMDQKYFDAMTTYFAQPSFKVPEKNFYLCVNYKPSFATLFSFSNELNLSNTSKTSCVFFDSLEELTPIGIAAKIIFSDKDKNFGMSILIPNINMTSLPKTILSKEEMQEIIDQQQYFMLYDINLPIQ
jgi:hypothetical protein